ncbi:MAG TPA: DUF1847 domain-containing protein [Syntrophomonadaceae bacterium]|nr:DUF1847 domain-containing protein [Syntrophomonadaceae bacterium]
MCAKCSKLVCKKELQAEDNLFSEAPEYCPMKLWSEVLKEALEEYKKDENLEFARLASVQEFECYENTPQGIRTKHPRIEELIMFAQKCNYHKLGIAFCSGLAHEARLLTRVLEKNGFEVVSVRCKVGAVPKEEIGIRPEEKIAGPEKWESMCNPISQALILNAEKVDLAIMLGLCIGHDTLFIKYCQRPMTVIAVKDRVTGHNPLAALYLSSSYYSRLMKE